MKNDAILSGFGEQMSHLTGVRAIMKDITETLHSAGAGRHFINLSPGNPVILPEVVSMWKECTAQLTSTDEYGKVVGRYGSSQGYEPLIEAVKDDFNKRYGLSLSDREVLITPGSQSLYFFASNIFAGFTKEKQLRKMVLPLSPDYTGYGGVCLTPEALVAYKPTLDIDENNHRFKYRPDFSQLTLDKTTGCVIFSRPCNPTGNVLTDSETQKIVDLAAVHHTPVFIDSAYAPPYPALNFTEMNPVFGDNVIHCMSLSKAGLPGERIGIAVGDPAILDLLERFMSNACIHSSRYGQAIAAKAITSGMLAETSLNIVRPYYKNKFAVIEEAIDKHFPQSIPWRLHRGEGALFSWIWFDNLPITDWQLYDKFKEKDVLIVPGSAFFPGLKEEWPHKHQCIRVSLTASDDDLREGVKRMAEVIEGLY